MTVEHDVRDRRGSRWAVLWPLLALGAACASPPTDGPDAGHPDADVDAATDADDPSQDADRQHDADGARDADDDRSDADDPPRDADPDPPDADAEAMSCEEMSEGCVAEFGSVFTRSNGRADGTLVALVEPTDSDCPEYNDDHVVLEVMMLGQVQRLVVSVDGVAVHRVDGQLLGPGFSEGWHLDMDLDYVGDLGVHSTDFTPVSMDEAVAFVCEGLEVGAPVSVFAYSDGSRPSSAHQVHWNERYPDGAIVAHPTAESPTYLLFRYADDVF